VRLSAPTLSGFSELFVFLFFRKFLPTNLVVRVEQSDRCMCVQAITFELYDLKARYLTCWFNLTLSRPRKEKMLLRWSVLSRVRAF